jgi:ubiquinone biosynthesis protein
MIFRETFKNISRLREIIRILVKYGFEEIITNSTLRNFVSESKRLTWLRQEKPVFEYTRWERIRMAAEELGPSFVKLAQIMSNRPDILPDALIKELEKLQDNVPPFEFKKVKIIIESELGEKLEELFDDFDPKPLASASIGQVHRARLKTGEEVVVKVQRPDVAELIDRDLSILKEVVRRADRYLKRQGIMNAADVIKTFERNILKELDYRNEGRNIETFRKTYADNTSFYVPRCYKEYSTEKVLVIEFAYGCKISNVLQLYEWGIDPRVVAENGMNVYLTQIFEYGYFHADPHPGNVLVKPDGTICLIDFGMVGQLMPKDKIAFAGIFISMAQQNAKEMAVNFKKLAIRDEIHDMREFEYDLHEIIEDFANLDISESNIADLVQRLQKIMFEYQITVPPGIFLIFRAMAILEGIGKSIHPRFNTMEFIKPFGEKILKEKFKPANIVKDLVYKIGQIDSMLNNFPGEVKTLFQKIEKGKLHFEIELQGYGYLLKKLDSLTNRISITIIISSLILGSSIVMTADIPQEARASIYNMPYIALGGFSTAIGLLLILFYSIIRRRKYK